jgi:hypothetical protein
VSSGVRLFQKKVDTFGIIWYRLGVVTPKIGGKAASPSILGLNSYKNIAFKPDL